MLVVGARLQSKIYYVQDIRLFYGVKNRRETKSRTWAWGFSAKMRRNIERSKERRPEH